MTHKYSSEITDDQYLELEQFLSSSADSSELFKNIVNAPFRDKLFATTIDLGIVVLLQVNLETKTIDRVALSDTDLAKKAVQVSAKEFHDIKIPISENANILSQAIASNNLKMTDDWAYLFNPALTPRQARLNQVNAGIECSVVYPLQSGNGGALIFSFYQPQISIKDGHTKFVKTYAKMVDRILNTYQTQTA